MDSEREAQHRRITEPQRSKAAKIGWKRHRDSYMRAARKRERDNMNKSFYSIAKELEECLSSLDEAKLVEDDVFDLNAQIDLNNIAGALSFHIDKETGEISFTVNLKEVGRGNYKLENYINEDNLKVLYEDVKDELVQLAQSLDEGMKQIIAKHGLKQA